MISPKVIFRNVGSVWLGFLVQLGITLYLTPILIAKLGQEGYGLWILIQSFTGYYGLIDMGLRAGVTQTVTKRIATGNRNYLISYFDGVLPVLAKVAAFVVIAGVIVGFVLASTLDVNPALKNDLMPMVILQSVGIGLTLVSFPFASVLVGLQRYDIAEGLAILTRFFWLAVTLAVLNTTSSLLFLSIASLCVNLFDQSIRCIVACKLVPELKKIRPKSDRTELRELYRVGGWNFAVNISQQMLQRFNTLLAAYMFSLTNIVPFNLAGSLAEHSGKITTLASRVLFPAFSHLSHSGNVSDVQRLFQISSRVNLTVSLVAITVGLVWFEPFMNIWLTKVPDKESVVSSAKSLFVVFGLINVLNSVRSIGWQLVMGKDRVEFIGKTMMFETVLAVLLAIVLALYLGAIGLVLGNLIAIFISTFWICLPTFSKMIHVSTQSNLIAVCVRPVLYTLCVGALLYQWSKLVTTPKTLVELLIMGAIPSLVVLIGGVPFLLTKVEREMVSARLFKLLRAA